MKRFPYNLDYLELEKANYNKNNKDSNTPYNLGCIELEKENYNKAIELFKEAITKNNKDGDAYYNLARAYLEIKDYKRTLNNLNMALKFSNKKFDIYNLKGRVYLKKKMYKEAKEAINKSIRLNEDYKEAYLNLFLVYSAEKNKKELKKLKDFFYSKKDIFYHENLAAYYSQRNDSENEKEELKKMLELSEDIKILKFVYAKFLTICKELSDYKTAYMTTKRLKNIKPNLFLDDDIKGMESLIYVELKKYYEGLEIIEELIEKKIHLGMNYFNKGLLEVSRRNFNQALKDFNRALYFNHEDSETYFMIGEVEQRKKIIKRQLKIIKKHWN